MSDRQKVKFTIFPFFFLKKNFYCFIGRIIDRIICLCARTWSRSQSVTPPFKSEVLHNHLLLHVEHRFCVRHLLANFKSEGYKDKAFKDELWGVARASNAMTFQHHMKVIQVMDAGAYRYLNDINPASWSRHAFSTHSKSNMFLNNLAETFNAWIKDSRDKPLLTMLEMIRRQLMARFQQKREGI